MKEKVFDNLRLSYNHKDAGKSFLWAVIAPYLMSFAMVFVAMMAYGQDGFKEALSSLGFVITSAIVTPLTFLAVFLIYNKVNHISFKAANIKFKLDSKTTLILVLVSFVCVFGLQYLITGIDIGLDALGYKLSESPIPLNNAWWYILNLFVLALLPAICEELVFRGMIFNGLRKEFGDWLAVFVSAVLFALMHASLEQLVYPLLLGMVFGWLVLRTKTVLSSMIVHFLNNAIVVTIAFVYEMTGFDFMPKQAWLFWFLAVGLALVTFGILFLIEKFFFKKKENVVAEEKKEDEQAVGKIPSVYLIIGVVIAVLLFVFNAVTGFMN